MPRASISTFLPAVLLVMPALSYGSVVDDDFEDGVRGSQWSLLLDDTSQTPALSVAEQGGHLNLVSTGGGVSTNDADYLSTFRVSALSDFVITLDYFLTPVNTFTGSATSSSGDKLGLVFGVGRDLDGTDSAAIGVGYGNQFGFVTDASTVAYRVDDVTYPSFPGFNELLSPTSGTLEIDYVAGVNALSDVLTLKRQGSAFSYSLPAGTVRNVWGASDLLISFGGRGSGFSSAVGQMYVDNFALVSGTIVPEPACLTLFGSVSLFVLRRHRRR